jgi:hypothetical protein
MKTASSESTMLPQAKSHAQVASATLASEE